MDKKESTILIDTDVLVNFFDTNKMLHQVAVVGMDDFKNANMLACISIVTTIEILQGNKTNNDKKRISQKLIAFEEINISDEISTIAKALIFEYSSTHGLMLADAFIASTALQLDIPLFTFNQKDFRFIKNLKLYEP